MKIILRMFWPLESVNGLIPSHRQWSSIESSTTVSNTAQDPKVFDKNDLENDLERIILKIIPSSRSLIMITHSQDQASL